MNQYESFTNSKQAKAFRDFAESLGIGVQVLYSKDTIRVCTKCNATDHADLVAMFNA